MIKVLIAILLISKYSNAAFCHGHPHPIPDNTKEIWAKEPKLVREITNGKYMLVGDPSLNNSMNLIHLWGDSYYDIGLTYGKLMKQELNEVVEVVWNYLDE